MTRFTETEPLAGADEALLRDLYREHAPARIETEHAWAALSQRLTRAESSLPLGGASVTQRRRMMGEHGGGRRFGWRARLGLAAALLALPVALMGAGLAKENLMPLDVGMQRINDEGLYTHLNQSQTLDGVTITLTAAYADKGRTVIYYRVQMSPELAQRHDSALLGAWSLTTAQGVESAAAPNGMGFGTCDAWDAATRSNSCYQIERPFQPGASARQIALSLDITRIYLPLRGANRSNELDGHWRFQFTIPFHQMNIASTDQFFPHLLHLAPLSQQP